MPEFNAHFSLGIFYRVLCITDNTREENDNQFFYGYLKIRRELISLVNFFLKSKKLKTEIPEFGKKLDAPWCEKGARLMYHHYASLAFEGEIIEDSRVPFKYYLDKIQGIWIPEIPSLRRANELIVPIFTDKRSILFQEGMDIELEDEYMINCKIK
jgi:hypothetical protein